MGHFYLFENDHHEPDALLPSDRPNFTGLEMFLTCVLFYEQRTTKSGVRKLTTFYLTKNDHRWVTFISLKTIHLGRGDIVVLPRSWSGLVHSSVALSKEPLRKAR